MGVGYATYETNSLNFNNGNKFITNTIVPYTKQYFPINKKFAFHLIGEVGFSKT